MYLEKKADGTENVIKFNVVSIEYSHINKIKHIRM